MGRVKLKTVKAFRNGDIDAFEDIFYAYKDILYYVSYFYVKDYDDANDCVQEIFIKMMNKIHLYNEYKAPFEPWLIILAKSCIINFIKCKNCYHEKVVINDNIVLNYPDNDNRLLEDTLEDLENLMGKEMYVIYILRTAYNISFENIAKMTNLKRETTRRIYYSSIDIVNKYMGDE